MRGGAPSPACALELGGAGAGAVKTCQCLVSQANASEPVGDLGIGRFWKMTRWFLHAFRTENCALEPCLNWRSFCDPAGLVASFLTT